MKPDEKLIQVREFRGEGFQPLVTTATWRVAMLRCTWITFSQPGSDNLERHILTDEVFVLVKGRGVLIIGSNGNQASDLVPQEMEIGVVYNVRDNTWHTILLSLDASGLIVENSDTAEENTKICEVNDIQRKQIVSIAHQFSFKLD